MNNNNDLLIETISLLLANNQPFASYHLPNDSEITTVIQKSLHLQVLNTLRNVENLSGFIFAPYHLQGKHPIIHIQPDQIFQTSANSIKHLPKHFVNSLPSSPTLQYTQQINSLLASIQQGIITKAILSRIITYHQIDTQHIAHIFHLLTSIYPTAFVSLVNIPNVGCWLTASPELLLSIDKQQFTTVALAGTKPADTHTQWTPKEIEEQKIVAHYIESILEQLNISYQKSSTQTITIGNLAHLKTDYNIPFEGQSIHIDQLIKLLHPTPAVCGTPKQQATELINKVEAHDREYYTGFLGPANLYDTTQFYVNIRTMKLNSDHTSLYVGGGITEQSNPIQEWQETNHKAQALINILDYYLKKN